MADVFEALATPARRAILDELHERDGQTLFELHTELMAQAHELVGECLCADGCPSCVGPGGEEGRGGKREALAILEKLAERLS